MLKHEIYIYIYKLLTKFLCYFLSVALVVTSIPSEAFANPENSVESSSGLQEDCVDNWPIENENNTNIEDNSNFDDYINESSNSCDQENSVNCWSDNYSDDDDLSQDDDCFANDTDAQSFANDSKSLASGFVPPVSLAQTDNGSVDQSTDADPYQSEDMTIQTEEPPYYTGNGIASDPYKVYNLFQLEDCMSMHPSSYIMLANDIYASEEQLKSRNTSIVFSGVLDGDGYLLDMNCLSDTSDNNSDDVVGNSGLVNVLEGGTVQNLILNYDVFTSLSNVGLIANTAKGNVLVENCIIYGSISSDERYGCYLGSIFGTVKDSENATFRNIQTNTVITATGHFNHYAGGFVGKVDNGDKKINFTIDNCENSEQSSVTASAEVSYGFFVLLEVFKFVAVIVINIAIAKAVNKIMSLINIQQEVELDTKNFIYNNEESEVSFLGENQEQPGTNINPSPDADVESTIYRPNESGDFSPRFGGGGCGDACNDNTSQHFSIAETDGNSINLNRHNEIHTNIDTEINNIENPNNANSITNNSSTVNNNPRNSLWFGARNERIANWGETIFREPGRGSPWNTEQRHGDGWKRMSLNELKERPKPWEIRRDEPKTKRAEPEIKASEKKVTRRTHNGKLLPKANNNNMSNRPTNGDVHEPEPYNIPFINVELQTRRNVDREASNVDKNEVIRSSSVPFNRGDYTRPKFLSGNGVERTGPTEGLFYRYKVDKSKLEEQQRNDQVRKEFRTQFFINAIENPGNIFQGWDIDPFYINPPKKSVNDKIWAMYAGLNELSAIGIIRNNFNVFTDLVSQTEPSYDIKFNSYAGGFVGDFVSDNGETVINIINSDNYASVTSGHNAGGFFGCIKGGHKFNFSYSNNYSTSICLDSTIYPSAGGFIGYFQDSENNSELNFEQCSSTGYTFSRFACSQFIGQAEDKDISINFKNCGASGGLVTSEHAGAYIGVVDDVRSTKIENCFSHCLYDTTSNEWSGNWFLKKILGVGGFKENVNEYNGNNKSGSLFGRLDNLQKAKVVNVCVQDGVPLIEGIEPNSVDFCKNNNWDLSFCSDYEFVSGVVAYKLNHDGDSTGENFGQAIDCSEDCLLYSQLDPIPGDSLQVFKNDLGYNNFRYSNYDNRVTNLHNVQIFNHNVSIEPEKQEFLIPDGYSFDLYATPDDGRTISSVLIEDDEQNKIFVDPYFSDGQTNLYCIPPITKNTKITFGTEKDEEHTPKGTGTPTDPILLYTKSDLKWFNENINMLNGNSWCAKLMNDIDGSGIDWTPILLSTVGTLHGYCGTFDGNHKTIYNISSSNSEYGAFFANVTDGGTVKNLTINGTFNNAIFAFRANNATFENCISCGTLNCKNAQIVGGIVAYSSGYLRVNNCINNVNIDFSSDIKYSVCGGIVGALFSDKFIFKKIDLEKTKDLDIFNNNVEISGCINNGHLSLTNLLGTNYFNNSACGGIIGEISPCTTKFGEGGDEYKSSNVKVKIAKSSNFSNIWCSQSAGGILGTANRIDNRDGGNLTNGVDNYLNVVACQNTGNIGYLKNNNILENSTYSGGIIGTISTNYRIKMLSCFNSGVASSEFGSGGFWGATYNDDGEDCKYQIENCVTIADCFVTSWTRRHGLIGSDSGELTSATDDWVYINSWYKDYDKKCIVGGLLGHTMTYSELDEFNGYTYDGKLIRPALNRVTDSMLSSGEICFILNGHYPTTWNYDPDFGWQNNNVNTIDYLTKSVDYSNDYYGQVLDSESWAGEIKNNIPYLLNDNFKYNVFCQGYKDIVYLKENNASGYQLKRDYIGFTNLGQIPQNKEKQVYPIKVSASGKGTVKYCSYAFQDQDQEVKFFPEEGWCVNKVIISTNQDDNTTTYTSYDNVALIKKVSGPVTIEVEFSNIAEIEPSVDDDAYHITNICDWNGIVDLCNTSADFSDKKYNVVLDYDLYINSDEFYSFHFSSKFIDVFNGKGHTIHVKNASKPLFDYVSDDASICNLNVEYESVNRNCESALIGKSFGATLENVHVSGFIKKTNTLSSGFIKEVVKGTTTINNCTSEIKINNNFSDNHSGALSAGFISLVSGGNVCINNSTNKGEIIAYPYESCSSYAAGAIAKIDTTLDDNVKVSITNFNNEGTIYAHEGSAGIIGIICSREDRFSSYIDILNCVNSGYIHANVHAAGIVAKCIYCDTNDLLNIFGCESSGRIYAQNGYGDDAVNASGIIGYLSCKFRCYISLNIVACPSIKCDHDNAGGIIGQLNNINDMVIARNLVTTTNFSADDYTGYLIGEDDDGDLRWLNNLHLSNIKPLGDESDSALGFINKEQLESGYACFECFFNKSNADLRNFYSNHLDKVYGENDDVKNRIFDDISKVSVGQFIDSPNQVADLRPHANRVIADNDNNNKDILFGTVYPNATNNGSGYTNIQTNQIMNNVFVEFVNQNNDILGQAPLNQLININRLNKQQEFTFDFKGVDNNIVTQITVGQKSYDPQDIGRFSENNSFYTLNLTSEMINTETEDCVLRILYSFGQVLKPNTEVQNDEEYYVLTSAYHVNWFTKFVNSDQEGEDTSTENYSANAVLRENIDMANFEWESIGSGSHPFKGKIFGEGHSIYNLHGNVCSFIEQSDNAVISNLNLFVNFEGSVVSGCVNHACDTTLLDINVSGTLTGQGYVAAGIAATISGCDNSYIKEHQDLLFNEKDNLMCKASYGVGTFISGCTNNVEFVFDQAENNNYVQKKIYNAGIVACQFEKSSSVISRCVNNSSISINDSVMLESNDNYCSGILGMFTLNKSNCIIYSCQNNGNLKATNVAGILSSVDDLDVATEFNCDISIERCSQKGDLDGKVCGGCISTLSSRDLALGVDFNIDINGFMNYASINALEDGLAGGIVGSIAGNPFNISIRNSSSVGDIFFAKACGGIVAIEDSVKRLSFENCYSVKVCDKSRYDSCGQFVGHSESKNSINYTNCYINNIDIPVCSSNEGITNGISEVSEHEIESGKLCLFLNSKGENIWGQYLKNDQWRNLYPVAYSEYKISEFNNGIVADQNNTDESVRIKFIVDKGKDFGKICYIDNDGSLGDECDDVVYIDKGVPFYVAFVTQDGYFVSDLEYSYNNNGQTEERKASGIELSKNPFKFDNLEGDTEVHVSFDNMKEPAIRSDDTSSVCLLTSYPELLWFAEQVNSGANTAIKGEIKNDIYAEGYSGNVWKPIGFDLEHTFKGSLVGKREDESNKDAIIVSGICPEKNCSVAAFINYADCATIENIRLENVCVQAKESAAGLIYRVCNSNNENPTTIKDIYVTGSITSAGVTMGAIVAEMGGCRFTMTSCSSNVTFNRPSAEGANVGGLIGCIYSNFSSRTSVSYTITNCNNFSQIYSNNCLETAGRTVGTTKDDFGGGIVGCIRAGKNAYVNADVSLTFSSNNNFAPINGEKVAGLIGSIFKVRTISGEVLDCKNFGHISGDYCAGLIGTIEEIREKCDSVQSLYIAKSSNHGYIGGEGVVYWDAGGLISAVTTGNIYIHILSCYNVGNVVNQPLVSSFNGYGASVFSLAGSGLMTAFSIAVASEVGVTTAATVGIGGVVAAVIVGLCLTGICVYNLVTDIMTSGSYIKQKAGGICGNINDKSCQLEIRDTYNCAYVSGYNYSDCIIGNLDVPKSGCVIKNVYTSSGVRENKLDGVTYDCDDKFKSGEIAYKLCGKDSIKNDTALNTYYGKWGQILDKLSLGSKMDAPTQGFEDAEVWAVNQNCDEFSNFMHCKEIESGNNVFVEIWQQDDNLPQSSEFYRKPQDFSDFEISIEGSISKNPQEINQNNNSFHILNEEECICKVKPKNNKWCIFDFQSYIFNIDFSETIYQEDGSFVKYFYSKKTLNNNAPNQVNWDYKVTYNIDGSVIAHIKSGINANINMLFTVKDNPIKIWNSYYNGGNKIVFPWNSSHSLPNTQGNFYLTNDVELDSSYTPCEGENSLCLNGHLLLMTDKASISCNQETPLYSIYDLSDSRIGHKLNYDQNNQVSFEEADFSQYLYIPEQYLNSTDYIFGGAIYTDSNYENKNAMINIDSTTFKTYDVNMFQPSNGSLVSYLSCDKSMVYWDSNIYRFSDIEQNNPTFIFDSANTDLMQQYDNFIFGAIFKFKDMVEQEKEFKYVDIYYNQENSSRITFENNYQFGHVFNFDCDNDANNINLTFDLGWMTQCGHDYKEYFYSINDQHVIALYKVDDNDYPFNPNDSFNNICLAHSDSVTALNVDVSGQGYVFPKGDNYYVSGTKAKFYYATNEDNILSSINECLYPTDTTYIVAKDSNLNTVIEQEYCTDEAISEKTTKVQNICGDFNLDCINNFVSTLTLNDQELELDNPVHVAYKVKFNFLSNEKFSSFTESFVSWKSVDKKHPLPENLQDEFKPSFYQLNDDICLDSSWKVPAGTIFLDLNGYVLSVSSDKIHSEENDNVIVLDKQNSNLIITDTRDKQEETQHYFEMDKLSGKYVLSNNTENSVNVAGGIVGGTDVRADSYYLYDRRAGAVLVKAGRFTMNAGNIAGNNSRDILGGAALTVEENGTAVIEKDARIKCNTSVVNYDYLEEYASAGIANKGVLIQNGIISNNACGSYSSSAVTSFNYDFYNSGTIENNLIVDDLIDEQLPYACVYAPSGFVNKGAIVNNKAEDCYPAVLVNGVLAVFENSKISNNTYTIKGNSKDYFNFDIDTTSFIDINGVLKNSDSPCYINADEYVSFTNNWSEQSLKINDCFTAFNAEWEECENRGICTNSYGELMLANDQNIVALNVQDAQNGSVDKVPERYLKYDILKLQCKPNDGYCVASVNIDNKPVDVYTADDNNFYVQTQDFDNDKICNIDVTFIKIPDIQEDDSFKAFDEYKPIMWISTNTLPSIAGKYILQNCVCLDDTWTTPKGQVILDINGFDIYSWNKDIACLINVVKDSHLKIDDSNTCEIERCVQVDGNGFYGFCEKSDNIIHGGIIGLCDFLVGNNASKSVIVVSSFARLYLCRGNISLNKWQNNNEAFCVETDGHIKIDESFNIQFNKKD